MVTGNEHYMSFIGINSANDKPSFLGLHLHHHDQIARIKEFDHLAEEGTSAFGTNRML